MKISFYSILVILVLLMIEKAIALESVNLKPMNEFVIEKNIEDLSSLEVKPAQTPRAQTGFL